VIGETGDIGQANYAAFVDTEMVAAGPKGALDRVIETLPMRRLGRASEIARMVRFLCEEESGYITGAFRGQRWAEM
jgi:NAD(P)-dependent dehydrogenase (short-subunit alcohol dehydrogenase family)